MKDGLLKIKADTRDYSLLHTFGAITPDPAGLPSSFSIYDGRQIPNQMEADPRFTPWLPPMPFSCTGQTGAFESGLQDKLLYNPQELYENTPPGGPGGRDIRVMLRRLIDVGPVASDGICGPRRKAYFNVYGAGKIDDFDAARIALWINQYERRGVYVGTYWYWGDRPETYLSLPSFKLSEATLHCYLITGWSDNYLEVIPWLGKEVGSGGKFYLSREIYNALMGQPWTGAFTITKIASSSPIPIGYQAIVDHLVYFVRNLFRL